MDHDALVRTHASERYLLGEMTELERHQFEEHYFTCAECAEEVRTGARLAAAARAVFAEEAAAPAPEAPRRAWREWLRWPVLAPSFAAACLAMVVSYQSALVIPALRQTAEPQALAPAVLHAATRGEGPDVPAVRLPAAGFVALALDVNAASPGARLGFRVQSSAGGVLHAGEAVAPPPGVPLVVLIPRQRITSPGAYEVALTDAAAKTLALYPFSVQN